MTLQIRRRQPQPWGDAWPPHLHPRLQNIYSARGVQESAQLNRSLSELYQPNSLKGLDEATQLLADMVTQEKAILIVGDFDADGATSSALCVKALRAMGAARVNYLVPNRFDYGYGLTPEIVKVGRAQHPDLIVTVDNGISSIEGVAAAKAYGIQVLITDHHLPGEQLPDADAIVNPNQPGCEFASKNLAGVGVAFYVLSALRAELRNRQWFQQRQLNEPNMATYLDLVALGTVADVVPLDKNNRILVHQGIERIRRGLGSPGVVAMLQAAGRDFGRVSASDFGFAVGPRLNAAGRLDDMSLGIECLLCDSPSLAREMAVELDELNQDRKQIQEGMQEQAEKSLDLSAWEQLDSIPAAVCLYDSRWHQGVIGILASRIKDKIHRPVIAFADSDSGEIKGSARSIPGLHIRDALDLVASRHPGLLTKFGGHAMAAGMTLLREDFDAFTSAFQTVAEELLNEEDLTEKLLTDGELAAEEFGLPLATALDDAGPWGQHFPEPLFDGHFTLIQQKIVGGRHLKMVVAPEGAVEKIIDAIAFNVDVKEWPNNSVSTIRAVYHLDKNYFRGVVNLQLRVQYFEAVNP